MNLAIMKDQSVLAQNIIEIYKKYAREWTALRGDFLYEKVWLDQFISLLPVHSKILDLGCGSAQPIAAYLIEQGHCVTGIDSSDVMIEMAQQHFPKQCWIEADMRSVKLDETFQGILAWDSFFHLTPHDQRQMFIQFARFSAKGTVLMFTSGFSHGEVIGDMFGEALYHASLAPEEYTKLLCQHDFEIVKIVMHEPECAGHTIWLAQKIK